METLFEQFKSLHIRQETKVRLMRDIFLIIIETIYSAYQNRFSNEAKNDLNRYAQQDDFEQVVEHIQEPFNEMEWKKITDDIITPLLSNYTKEVLYHI